MDLLLVRLTVWFSLRGQAVRTLASVKSRLYKNHHITHSHTHLYKHLFHDRGFNFKKNSLAWKIPVHFEIVYFLSILLLLHFSSNPALSVCDLPWVWWQRVSTRVTSCIMLPQLLETLTKVRVESQRVVITSFFFFFFFIANARGVCKCLEIMLSLACVQLEEALLWSPAVTVNHAIFRTDQASLWNKLDLYPQRFVFLFQVSKYMFIPFPIWPNLKPFKVRCWGLF